MTNKIILIFALILMSAGISFATETSTEGQTLKKGNDVIVKLSANVAMSVASNAESYAVASKATKGTRVYATSAQETSIWALPGTVDNTVDEDFTLTNSDSQDFAGATNWESM